MNTHDWLKVALLVLVMGFCVYTLKTGWLHYGSTEVTGAALKTILIYTWAVLFTVLSGCSKKSNDNKTDDKFYFDYTIDGKEVCV